MRFELVLYLANSVTELQGGGAGLGDLRLLGRVSTPLYAILIHCIFFVLVPEISNFMKGNFLFLNLNNC